MNIKKAVIIEVEGGIDKDNTGHRPDTQSIIKAFNIHGWEAFTIFYRNDGKEDLYQELVAKKVDYYVSRIDPGYYHNYTEEEYLKFLHRLIAAGIKGTTEPDTMMKLGTKQILYQLRNTSIGSVDVEIYKTKEELSKGLLDSLKKYPEGRVLKQNRGAGGKGVYWIVLSISKNNEDIIISCREAHDAVLTKFNQWNDLIDFLSTRFLINNNSLLINMPYYKNVKEGEVRCVMAQDKPICIVHKHPKSDENGDYFSCTRRAGAEIEYVYDFQQNPEWNRLIETTVSVIPQLQQLVEIITLPHLWTIDFIKNNNGKYVLGEINCSCFGYGVQNRVGEAMVDSIVKSEI